MSDRSEPPALPARLGRRFALGEPIGYEAGSRVYRAQDTLLDRPAAVKVFPVADDPRSRREVGLLAALDHPALVPVYDVDEVDGRAVVVTALYDGGSLADRLAVAPLPLGEALLVAASVADALDHVHRAGVLHRAVTPRNVLFDADGRAILSDFGVALVADAPRMTDTGDVVGEPHYLAPEQVRGAAVGTPADVYALGLVLIESLTGRRAFDGEPLAAAHERLERDPEVPPGVPEDVRALVTEMTASDPARRPRAGEVTVSLRRAALAGEVVAAPVPLVPGPRRPMHGRGVLVAGGVVMSAVLAGTVVLATTRPIQEISATLPPAAAAAAPAVPHGPPPSSGSGSDSGADGSGSDAGSGSDPGSDGSGALAGSSGARALLVDEPPTGGRTGLSTGRSRLVGAELPPSGSAGRSTSSDRSRAETQQGPESTGSSRTPSDGSTSSDQDPDATRRGSSDQDPPDPGSSGRGSSRPDSSGQGSDGSDDGLRGLVNGLLGGAQDRRDGSDGAPASAQHHTRHHTTDDGAQDDQGGGLLG